jgi:hypothetical protein
VYLFLFTKAVMDRVPNEGIKIIFAFAYYAFANVCDVTRE